MASGYPTPYSRTKHRKNLRVFAFGPPWVPFLDGETCFWIATVGMGRDGMGKKKIGREGKAANGKGWVDRDGLGKDGEG